jgi:hypothetical protein
MARTLAGMSLSDKGTRTASRYYRILRPAHASARASADVWCSGCFTPLCRYHHRCKQAEGWQLTQPEPGVMTWRLPSGRVYQTTGDRY